MLQIDHLSFQAMDTALMVFGPLMTEILNLHISNQVIINAYSVALLA